MIEPCKAEDGPAVTAFVEKEYPGWARYFTGFFQTGLAGDVLAVRQRSGLIAGACLVETPSPRWEGRFSGPTAAPGCILTAEAARGQGIGLALAARATGLAHARGFRTSVIGWTLLVDWYGKLGYRPWQSYVMSSRSA